MITGSHDKGCMYYRGSRCDCRLTKNLRRMRSQMTTLKQYLNMDSLTRSTLDPKGLLEPFAIRYAKQLREAAQRIEKLNAGVATDLRETANWLVGAE